MPPEAPLITVLNWERQDIEQRLCVPGGKYTDVNPWLALLLGLAMMAMVYLAAYFLRNQRFGDMLLNRGITPWFIVLFACWALAMLTIKSSKLRLQKKALSLMVVPHSHDFVLTPATAPEILERMYGLVDDPRHFILLCRIDRALANLSNIGMIADVSEMLRAQAQNDEDHMESSYSLVRGFIWGIPVLGFIGTVLGLSSAIGRFGAVLAAAQDLNLMKNSLRDVTSGLSIAFDTTLLALIAAFVIHLLMTAMKKHEENFHDECREYCHAHIVSKLRLFKK